MWIEGHWFSKDLLGQLILIWLVGICIVAVIVWRLRWKSGPSKRAPATRSKRRSRR